MLQSIRAVTHTVADLEATERAYTAYLGYRVVRRDTVPEDLANFWGAARLSGAPRLVLQPESGADACLVFIEQPATPGYLPLRHYGWAATELLVQDVDALQESLWDSPFAELGPPRPLSSSGELKAMQVAGPDGEVLYLTRMVPTPHTERLGVAESPVDRVFICVLAVDDLDAAGSDFAARFGQPVEGRMGVRMSVMSRAHGLDPETRHEMITVPFPSRFLFEVDRYPAPSTTPRPRMDGYLPPGMAMVTVAADATPDGPTRLAEDGGTVTLVTTVGGALMEVVTGGV